MQTYVHCVLCGSTVSRCWSGRGATQYIHGCADPDVNVLFDDFSLKAVGVHCDIFISD